MSQPFLQRNLDGEVQVSFCIGSESGGGFLHGYLEGRIAGTYGLVLDKYSVVGIEEQLFSSYRSN